MKAQLELANCFGELAGAVESLGSMETQIRDPLLQFAQKFPEYATLIREKV